MALFAVAGAATGAAVRGVRRRGGLARAPLPPTPAPPGEDAPGVRAAIAGAAVLALLVAAPLGAVWVWAIWCLALGVAAFRFVWREPVIVAAPARERGLEAALWATALSCAIYALVAHRADVDDAFYVNVAIAAIDRPDLPLLAVDTLHGRDDLPIHFPVYRIQSLELAYAALAWLLGVPAIGVFHLFGAAVAAAALPLAHAALLRTLLPRDWLAAVAALLFVLVVVGETHRWHGNFALVRIWQGKAILLFVFLPLVAAFAIRFARRPTGRHGLLLAAAQIGALGASANALWLAPWSAGVALLCALPPGREGLRRAALGALASAYGIAAGLALRGDMVERAPTLARVYRDGELLAEALARTLGEGRFAAVAIAAVAAAWALCPRGLARRFAILAPLCAALALLSPFADGFVRAHVTGPAYWRAAWALPVPLLLALVLVAPLAAAGPQRRRAAAAASLVLALAFALFVPSSYGFSESNEVVLRWPGAKRPPAVARWAALVNERAPGRRVLAPPAVSDWIPTYHEHAFPLLVRDYLQPSRHRVGPMAYRERHLMTRYAGGRLSHEGTPAIFARGLDLYGVELVCLRVSEHVATQRGILRDAGFARSVAGVHYEIWEREAEPSARRALPTLQPRVPPG